MTQDTALRINEDLEKAEGLIATARRLLGEGRQVDLAALEDRVRELTQTFRNADTEVSRPLKPAIEKLIDSLAALESELKTHHQQRQNGLEKMNRQRAGSAYKKDGN